LTTYLFNTGVAKHLFCSVCGIKSFYVPRSNPDGFSINARCLDGVNVQEMTITPFNGQQWEAQYPSGQGPALEVTDEMVDKMIEVNIKAALRLIRTCEWSLNEIAEHVGFGSRTTLFRRLKAHTGATSNAFRSAGTRPESRQQEERTDGAVASMLHD